MKYYVLIESRDDCDLPTTPEPMHLSQIGEHLARTVGMYERQGYFSNCRQERIPIAALTFRIVPETWRGDQ